MASRTCNQFSASGTCSYGNRCRFSHTNTAVPVRQRRNEQTSVRHGAGKHMDDFFARYHFPYDSSQPSMDEFYRMCDSFGWMRQDSERENARQGLKDAMLCQVLQVSPIPEGLEACREKVKNTHVNMVDLVDTPNTGKSVEVFHSEQALSEYTKSTGKYFPRDNAYAGGVLRFLLRHIENPRVIPSNRNRTSRRGGRRRLGRSG